MFAYFEEFASHTVVSSILNTAEYSQDTVGQLEEKLKEKVRIDDVDTS